MCRGRFLVRLIVIVCAIAGGISLAQTDPDLQAGPQAFPKLTIPDVGVIKFVRMFSADQDVNRRKLNLVVGLAKDAATGAPEDSAQLKIRRPQDSTSSEVIHSSEVVTDVGHAVQPLRSRTPLGELADTIAGLSPNHDLRMTLPYRLAVDSRQRIIVTDPPAHAVHIFDFKQKKYLRIQGGDRARLHTPTAVAVDAEDRIYVTDSSSGLVLVYDSQGRFLRSFADQEGEGVLDQPDGIAVDFKTGRIYVSDSPRHLLYMFDRDGKVLARIGTVSKRSAKFGRRGVDGTTDLRLHGNELILADGNSCAVKFYDLDGHLQRDMEILGGTCGLRGREAVGLDVDEFGNLYLSDAALSTVRVYDENGKFRYAFGNKGSARGEFASPSCVRVDSKGLVYVADSANRRVQVFEFHAEKSRESKANLLERWREKHGTKQAEDKSAEAER